MVEKGAAAGRAARARIRTGDWNGHTSRLAVSNVQANIVILPSALANDFLRFCQADPKPCPVLAVSEPGSPALPALGEDIDLRTDLPRYRVFCNGKCVATPREIGDLWRMDLATFALGCSFSLEQALVDAGLTLRHWEEGKNVAMYRTSIACRPAGILLVLSSSRCGHFLLPRRSEQSR